MISHRDGGRSRRRRPAALLAGAALALALAGCSSGASGPPPSSTGGSGPGSTTPLHAAAGLVWVISRGALAQVASLDPAALRVLEAGRIYELVNARQHPVAGVDAILTQDFTSYAGLSAAVQEGLLAPGVQAVLYDPEHWSLTPPSEQRDVTTYIADAVALAHAHGLRIVVTPALDLTSVVAPGARGSSEVSRFLASGIEQAAAAADVVDVQAQSREHDPATYAAFVLQAAAAVHARRAGAVVVAGLSTNPPSGAVTASQLAAAITAVQGHVQGFWLNIPKQGTSCPGCGAEPDPQAGTGALVAVFG